jgi:fructose-1-phosphate kinase PfkB-like protein
MNIVDSTGAKEVHVWERGHAYWLPAMPPGTTHSDVNAGKSPIEVMVVELKNDK